jgi:hypothetical protein
MRALAALRMVWASAYRLLVSLPPYTTLGMSPGVLGSREGANFLFKVSEVIHVQRR